MMHHKDVWSPMSLQVQCKYDIKVPPCLTSNTGSANFYAMPSEKRVVLVSTHFIHVAYK